MKESELGKKIMVYASRLGLRLFRNNTGTGWTGKRIRVSKPQNILITPDDVLIKNARPLHAGLCVGSSDYIGWRSIKIAPHHVGMQLAVFVGWEVKTSKGRATQDQLNFRDTLSRSGGEGIITYGEAGASAEFERLRG